MCPSDPQWFRGAVCERAAGDALRVCFVDYGNMEDVPVADLRKMPPDFVRGLPALASHLEIEGEVTPGVSALDCGMEGLERGTYGETNCFECVEWLIWYVERVVWYV